MTATPVRLGGPLVGMHFRPPASDVVNLLPAGCPLILQRQPENQYDTNAVQVLLPGFCKGGALHHIWQPFANDALGDPELMERLQDPLFIGYVANSEKTGGKKADLIAREMDTAGYFQVEAALVFSPKGSPEVITDCQPVPEVEDETCPECGESLDDCICEDEQESPEASAERPRD